VQIWGPQAPPDIEHGPVDIVDLPIENGDFPGYPKNSPSSLTVDFPMPNADFPVRKLSTLRTPRRLRRGCPLIITVQDYSMGTYEKHIIIEMYTGINMYYTISHNFIAANFLLV
jgi:hypothetical protein